MHRKTFITQAALATAGFIYNPNLYAMGNALHYPVVRPPLANRKFSSPAIENIIAEIKNKIGNKELAWLFENCYPNTLDTTVDYSNINNQPDTYVITGDIDAMWLRDSTAQVTPYLSLINQDANLKKLIQGVIHRQTNCILLDPYANAFFKDGTQESYWKKDLTDMKPGIHERKWEIDSLCYPIRLAYLYYTTTNDLSICNATWLQGIEITVDTFITQQRKTGKGPYKFERITGWAIDSVPLGGYGYPTKYTGLISSMFRPSDDATIYPNLIPSNYFAKVSLEQVLILLTKINAPKALMIKTKTLLTTLTAALSKYSTVTTKEHSTIYAYEVNGYGSHNLMDDANIPSLLSMPYLGAVPANDTTYANTRKYILSTANPFYYTGTAGAGIGGPHVGVDMIWPLSIIMRGLTSTNPTEIKYCLQILQKSNAGTGFMHEAFHKNDFSNYTRKWFAWANTLFGEFILKTYRTQPQLLN